MKTKAVASAKVKTDKLDARILAHLLRADLIAESYVPQGNVREMRALVRHRLSLVQMQTMVKNKVRQFFEQKIIVTEHLVLWWMHQITTF